jgi:hypothetical protein
MRKTKYLVLLIPVLALSAFIYFKIIKKDYRVKDSSTEILSNYPKTIDSITTIKKKLKNKDLAEKGSIFTQLITKRVFSYWYGTKWGFYGTTEKPNDGKIACGYFVTTTLRDMGYPINRVKLAQFASEKMITSLISESNIKRFSNTDMNSFEKELKRNGKGLFIVGLDNHTGFLLIDDKENYFIHSSGAYPYKVVKDILSKSPILKKSKYKIVGKISDDEIFLNKWINN